MAVLALLCHWATGSIDTTYSEPEKAIQKERPWAKIAQPKKKERGNICAQFENYGPSITIVYSSLSLRLFCGKDRRKEEEDIEQGVKKPARKKKKSL